MTLSMHAPASDHVRAGVSAQAMEWTQRLVWFSHLLPVHDTDKTEISVWRHGSAKAET
jgi:hypothetical protein